MLHAASVFVLAGASVQSVALQLAAPAVESVIQGPSLPINPVHPSV